ncbi:MAG: response regulator transcription factor [Verrucomicrobiota bacterium]|nr:response regulator transcription factor [Verrucomicrobiota bacterium]
MVKEHILITEDEPDIQELIKFNLERKRYSVDINDSGEEALKTIDKINPDLILLDIMLPGIDGLEILKELKSSKNTRKIPVIIISALSEEADIVAGLELGADDYLSKPFRPRELTARIKALLRRNTENETNDESQRIKIHNIEIDLLKHKVKIDGKKAILTFTEFKVLKLFMQQPGRVFTRYQIVDEVHGNDYPVTDRSVDVQIVGLRKKLGKTGELIETVRGIGYRFREDEQGAE